MTKKRVIIAAGGTGGHLYPAMTLAKQLSSKHDILFIGGSLSTNTYFKPTEFTHYSVSCSPWRGVNPKSIWNLLWHNAKGFFQSRSQFSAYNPDIVIGFGSYHTLPVMAATLWKRVPLFLYEANSLPGKMISTFSKHADITAYQFPLAAEKIRGKSCQVSISQRYTNTVSRLEALQYYGFSNEFPILLIAGGSQGAEALNQLISKILCQSFSGDIQVLHLLGKNSKHYDYVENYAKAGIHAVVKEYEDRMDNAWSAADVYFGRAGAGTVSELIQFQVPALLIPYPHAADHHQDHNAQFVCDVVGGGLWLKQNDITSEKLKSALVTLLHNKDEFKAAIGDYLQQQNYPTLLETVEHFISRV